MERLIPVTAEPDILPAYRKTPIETLLAYQNLNRPHGIHDKAELLIGMCMDNRKHLRVPENFAYIIRAGGGNLRYSEFKVSYAIAIGGISAIALLAHTAELLQAQGPISTFIRTNPRLHASPSSLRRM